MLAHFWINNVQTWYLEWAVCLPPLFKKLHNNMKKLENSQSIKYRVLALTCKSVLRLLKTGQHHFAQSFSNLGIWVVAMATDGKQDRSPMSTELFTEWFGQEPLESSNLFLELIHFNCSLSLNITSGFVNLNNKKKNWHHSRLLFGLWWLLYCGEKGMEKVKSLSGSSRAPPRGPSSGWRPTRAAHSAVQMRAHLSAAHFVNEGSPVIDSSPLHPAMVERRCSLNGVLRSRHPCACQTFCRAPVDTRICPRMYRRSKTFPSPLSLPRREGKNYTRSRVRLQTRFAKPCPLLLCYVGELTAPFCPALAVVQSEALKKDRCH